MSILSSNSLPESSESFKPTHLKVRKETIIKQQSTLWGTPPAHPTPLRPPTGSGLGQTCHTVLWSSFEHVARGFEGLDCVNGGKRCRCNSEIWSLWGLSVSMATSHGRQVRGKEGLMSLAGLWRMETSNLCPCTPFYTGTCEEEDELMKYYFPGFWVFN